MNEIDILRKLAAAARPDAPPDVDVAGRVLRTVRGPAPAPQTDRALWVLAAVSSVAAAVVAAVAAQSYLAWQDPLQALFGPAGMVMR